MVATQRPADDGDKSRDREEAPGGRAGRPGGGAVGVGVGELLLAYIHDQCIIGLDLLTR